MAKIDIRALGFPELEAQLSSIVDKAQKSIVATALRKESFRTRRRIVANILSQGLVRSGTMLKGYQAAKVRRTRAGRGLIRLGVENPTRDVLNIGPRDKFYYPYAVEFGHSGARPKPFIRPAVDEHKDASYKAIGNDIGIGIIRQAKRGKRK